MTTTNSNGRRDGYKRPHSKPIPAGAADQAGVEEAAKHLEISAKSIFEHRYQGILVRFFIRDGETWFYSNELCAVLGHANPRQAIKRLEPDERGVSLVDTPGGRQEVNVVNESGLYALIWTSRKPEAKAFRRWIKSEVLPALRRSGTYTVGTSRSDTASETVTLSLTEAARYVIMVAPGKTPHIRQTPYEVLLDEWSAFDTEILANHMRTVHAYWQKTQMARSVGGDPAGTPLYDRLGKVIADGRQFADAYLDSLRREAD